MTRAAALEAALVVAGRVAFVGLWFCAVLVIYRGLGSDEAGVAQAGVFAVAMAVIKVVSGCVADPVDLALMRRAPGLLASDRPAAFRLLRAGTAMRLGAAAAVALVLLLAAPLIAEGILGKPHASAAVRLLAAAVLGEMLFRSVVVVLQAGERFRRLVALEGLLQVARFASVATLWALGSVRVDLVLAAYAAASLGAALVGLLALPRGLLASPRFARRDLAEVGAYLRWMLPAMALAALAERLDVFLVYHVSGPGAAGLYGAMLTLALVPDILAGCLSGLLQPRIARLHARGDFPDAARRFALLSLPVCGVAFVAALLLAEPVVGLALGDRYLPAIPVLLWLLAGTLFWLAVTPLPMTLVAVFAPSRTALVTVGQAALLLALGAALLPAFGPVGMAMAVCATRVAVAVALWVMGHRLAAPAEEAPPAALAPAAGSAAR